MKLVAFSLPGKPQEIRYGHWEANKIVETDAFSPTANGLGPTYYPEEVIWQLPVPCFPSKILAIGLNYTDHINEMKHESVPEDPVMFLKASSALIPSGQSIVGKSSWGRVDYEGEVALVIGKKCKNVPEEDALEVILGYTLANDVTARELQRKDTQWGRAKNFDTFCPLGPALWVNEGQDPEQITLETRVNGELRQSGHVAHLRFKIPFLIRYISSIMTLNPGDVILTGTPQGVAPLQQGDCIDIHSPQIGTLSNPYQLVEAE